MKEGLALLVKIADYLEKENRDRE